MARECNGDWPQKPVWCRTCRPMRICASRRSEEHTSELQSLRHLVCRLLLEKKKKKINKMKRGLKAEYPLESYAENELQLKDKDTDGRLHTEKDRGGIYRKTSTEESDESEPG